MNAMDQDRLTLASVLCARVCHDLAGTLGALSGLLDMVAEANDAEAMALAQDCARELTARLRLLRAAWGAEAETGDLAALLPGLPGAEKLAVNIEGLAGLDSEPVSQLAASLLLVAAGALPRGGTIWLSGEGRRLLLRIEGSRAGWAHGLAAEDGTVPEPRGVGAVIARLQAARLGLALRIVSAVELEAA